MIGGLGTIGGKGRANGSDSLLSDCLVDSVLLTAGSQSLGDCSGIHGPHRRRSALGQTAGGEPRSLGFGPTDRTARLTIRLTGV
ncbi:MAG: hypothetical protein ACK4XK_01830, partial [Casimicrobiaceae bacterium]